MGRSVPGNRSQRFPSQGRPERCHLVAADTVGYTVKIRKPQDYFICKYSMHFYYSTLQIRWTHNTIDTCNRYSIDLHSAQLFSVYSRGIEQIEIMGIMVLSVPFPLSSIGLRVFRYVPSFSSDHKIHPERTIIGVPPFSLPYLCLVLGDGRGSFSHSARHPCPLPSIPLLSEVHLS